MTVARAPRSFPVPPALLDQVRQFAAAPSRPVVPRASSTVMVVRDASAGGVGGLEVFMLRRVATMAFAPLAMVFPGGGVDDRDADPHLPWAGPDAAHWAAWLGASEHEARELVVAAAREVFEECGLLLAGPDAHTVIADIATPDWHAERTRLLSHEQSFAELLIRRGLVLRTDLLRPWAHWITPEYEPRRYDTRFFVAEVPAGQTPDDQSTEADHADWARPVDLLAAADTGRALLLPPTRVCLEQLAAVPAVAELDAHRPPIEPVLLTPDLHTDPPCLRGHIPAATPGGAA